MSCSPAGNCAVGGWYDTPAINGAVAFTARYHNGRWTGVVEIPGLEALDTAKSSQVNSLSCTRGRFCAVGGSYSTTEPDLGPAFVASEKNGTRSQEPLPKIKVTFYQKAPETRAMAAAQLAGN